MRRKLELLFEITVFTAAALIILAIIDIFTGARVLTKILLWLLLRQYQ